MLDALEAADARATFFVLGERVEQHGDLLARTVEAGHAVEVHVSKADGSVGRILEGHFNAYERLQLEGIDPHDHLLGVWGADPAPAPPRAGRACSTRRSRRRSRSWRPDPARRMTCAR